MINSICDEAEITTDDGNRSSGLINEQEHCDGRAGHGLHTNVLLWDWIINTSWPLHESRDTRVVIISQESFALIRGKCEDMRDFIWLLRSYLINSWIRQNLSRVATTTSARGIEQQPDWDIPPDIRLRLGTNQRPVLAGVTNQRPGSGVSVCIAEDQLSPHQPTLASLSCTPAQSILARNSPELKQNLPHWIGLLRQRLQNMMKRKMFNPSLITYQPFPLA